VYYSRVTRKNNNINSNKKEVRKMINIQKCAVIGCGYVGATCAFSLVQSSLFSELVLIDYDHEKAIGEAMDLNHGLPFVEPMNIYAGSYSDLSDCYLIIIAAGGGQKPNQKRLDLVKQNSAIMKSIVTEIIKFNSDGIILVVSNPVDILTYVAMKASGFPSSRVLGSGTVLDTSRLKYLLGGHLGVDSRSVHAFIIGEHGDSELPVWSSANVSGIDLDGFCCSVDGKCSKQDLDDIYSSVRNSAYEIIKRKGATYYAIGLAVTRIAQCIVKNQHSVLPVSCLVNNHYGLNDVYMGIPAIVGSKGVEKVLDIPLNKEEQQSLEKSAKLLKEIISQLDV
jgi:L-lactate dehydrogenase